MSKSRCENCKHLLHAQNGKGCEYYKGVRGKLVNPAGFCLLHKKKEMKG